MSCKVKVDSLTKEFRLYENPRHRLIEWITLGARKSHRRFKAIDNLSFSLEDGEWFGIIGPNGAGKSTLLKLLTGVLLPTSGSFQVNGRVTSLLELGTGFHPELPACENIYLSARLVGMSDKYVDSHFDEIIQFAELEGFETHPLKHFSSGMVVRLAFSIFAFLEPDIFIIDEALAVGDLSFSRKCIARLDMMRKRGCSVLFVTHDMGAVRKYCDRALYLDHGKCVAIGDPIAVTDMYTEAQSPGGQKRALAPQPSSPIKSGDQIDQWRRALPDSWLQLYPPVAFEFGRGRKNARIGSGEVKIRAIVMDNLCGGNSAIFKYGEIIQIDVLVFSETTLPAVSCGIQVVNHLGIPVWGTQSGLLWMEPLQLDEERWYSIRFEFKLDIGAGDYTVDIGIGDASGEGHSYDRITAVRSFCVEPLDNANFVGLVSLPAAISCHSASTGGLPLRIAGSSLEGMSFEMSEIQ